MEMLQKFLTTPADFLTTYILPFVVVLSILVFVHEWGHYIIARLCGVKVEMFSIGFGAEIFGWTDKAGTRWKFSWVPLGGYVQMFGDTDPASVKHRDEVEEGDRKRPFTEEEKKVAFFTQPVAKRSAIIVAGPAVNFIFAIIILTALYAICGQPYTPPIVAKLVVGSPAEKAGILPDDKILAMNGRLIERFQDMAQYTAISLNKAIDITLVHSTGKDQWSDQPVIVRVTPVLVEDTDRFGFKSQRGRIGVISPSKPFAMKQHTPVSAFAASFKTVWEISADTLKAIGQILMGTRDADELGGILRIGAYAGDFAQQGFTALVTFTALLSVNLGLINLLPIPILDGGHLTFYAMETLKGKPMSDRFQEYALRVGLATLLGIMLFATWNDLVQLKVFSYLKSLIT
ncbi:MAG: RIP metalloprotease [Pseudomonadota bacterium]